MKNLFLRLTALKDTRGQDLIEYALMAGFVAVAAGAVISLCCIEHQHDLLEGWVGAGGCFHAEQLGRNVSHCVTLKGQSTCSARPLNSAGRGRFKVRAFPQLASPPRG